MSLEEGDKSGASPEGKKKSRVEKKKMVVDVTNSGSDESFDEKNLDRLLLSDKDDISAFKQFS